jgi:hypothetical protein
VTAIASPRHADALVVSPDTRIADVLERYGDIADVMESLGVKRVGRFNVRRLLGKAITVRLAARVHRLGEAEMVETLQTAIDRVHAITEQGVRS